MTNKINPLKYCALSEHTVPGKLGFKYAVELNLRIEDKKDVSKQLEILLGGRFFEFSYRIEGDLAFIKFVEISDWDLLDSNTQLAIEILLS